MVQITAHRIITLVFLLLNVGLVTIAQVLLKSGVMKLHILKSQKNAISYISDIVFNPYIVIGTACYVLSLVVWIYILTRSQLSIAYPIMSLSYVTVMVLSVLLFNETINTIQWTGALFIVIGTSLIFLFK